MFGYIATGSSRNDASPAITMNAETTVANSGRSMKKFEITSRSRPAAGLRSRPLAAERRDVLRRGWRALGGAARVAHADSDRAGVCGVRGSHELRVAFGQRDVDVEPIGLDEVGEQARVVAGRHEAAFGAHLATRE